MRQRAHASAKCKGNKARWNFYQGQVAEQSVGSLATHGAASPSARSMRRSGMGHIMATKTYSAQASRRSHAAHPKISREEIVDVGIRRQFRETRETTLRLQTLRRA